MRERGRERRRRAGLDEKIVDTLEPCALLGRHVGAEELVELGRTGHDASSFSRTSARRASALRVLVLTVPSGMFRKSAISLCERPLQYASSSTLRSFSARSSSARWTRSDVQLASACSSGPASGEGVSGGSAAGSRRER